MQKKPIKHVIYKNNSMNANAERTAAQQQMRYLSFRIAACTGCCSYKAAPSAFT